MEVIKNECISKLDVVRILQKAYAEGRVKAKDGLASVLDDINAADVQPVEHSRWIPMNDGTYNAYCENCGHERGSKAWNKADYKYCPNCGARMDGDTND